MELLSVKLTPLPKKFEVTKYNNTELLLPVCVLEVRLWPRPDELTICRSRGEKLLGSVQVKQGMKLSLTRGVLVIRNPVRPFNVLNLLTEDELYKRGQALADELERTIGSYARG